MAQMGANLRQEMAQMGADLRQEMGEMRGDLLRQMAADRFDSVRWAFLFWIGQVVALGSPGRDVTSGPRRLAAAGG
jgi:hypothetical protein